MEGSAELIDKQITLAINSLSSPVTDFIWQVFSFRPLSIALCVCIVALMFVRLGWKRALVVVIACILCITACDQLGNIVKHATERLRPMHDPWMLERGLNVLENPGGLYSFYSAHAANTLGFAVCSFMGFRIDKSRSYSAYGIIVFLFSFLVGMSRIFVGKHFLGDVLAGFAVGAMTGLAFGWFARLVIRKLKLS